MNHDHAQAIVTFLWWITHQGQTYSAALSYVALPPNVVAFDESAINSVVFNGAALTSH
jgi:hypothetical protein